MKTLIIIQARTGSTRLPNKVLLPLAHAPLLQRMIERVQSISSPAEIIVATTTDRNDDPIRDLCRTIGVQCFSGHPTDLLDRHFRAAQQEHADLVVKIPSDCPLIDPAVIDRVLRFRNESGRRYDYVGNLHPATYPDGNDVEVMTFEALETAWRDARKNYEREHTTPYLWEHPELFSLGNVEWELELNYSMTHRWTIDFPEDYEFIKRVYNELWEPRRPHFSLQEILALVTLKPEIHRINARYAGVNWYRHHIGELLTVSVSETKQLN